MEGKELRYVIALGLEWNGDNGGYKDFEADWPLLPSEGLETREWQTSGQLVINPLSLNKFLPVTIM